MKVITYKETVVGSYTIRGHAVTIKRLRLEVINVEILQHVFVVEIVIGIGVV